jgi:RHS repeat-associated protein
VTLSSRARLLVSATAVLLVASALQAMPVLIPSLMPKAAAVVTGSGGEFVPATGRLLDTRYGTGGYSTPMPAGQYRTITAAGAAGLPSSGVAAVQVTLTVPAPTTGGNTVVRPSGGVSSWQALIYAPGGAVSNTTIVALGPDGKFEVKMDTSENLIIDVQGYYTTGATTAGGFVPSLSPARLAATSTGLGLPRAPLAAGTTVTLTAAGNAGIPAGASAVYVNFTVTNHSPNTGALTPYAADQTQPAGGMNFQGRSGGDYLTTLGQTVTLSADGKFKVAYAGANTATIDLIVDVVGYFTDTTGAGPESSSGAGAFTPASARLVSAMTIAAGATAPIPIAGVQGVPALGAGVSAIAVNIQAHEVGGVYGDLQAWPDSITNPGTAVLVYTPDTYRSNFTTLGVGTGGGIIVYNHGSNSVTIWVDLAGWWSTQNAVVADGQSVTQRAVTLQASGAAASGRTWVTYKYREGSTGAFTTNVPLGNVTDSSGAHPPAWPVQATGSGTSAKFAAYTWDLADTFGVQVQNAVTSSKAIQVVACYGTSGTDSAPRCGTPWGVTYAPTSFGYAQATTAIGPGTLSLLTGDLQVSATDASAVSSLGGLSIGRTLTTLKDPSAASISPAAGVFGPGWTADLTGPDAGDATLTVADHHAQGYLTFTDSDGGTYVYQAAGTAGTTTTYTGVGDAAGDGVVVTMDSASPNLVTMVEADGTRTTFQLVGTPAVWRVDSVVEPGSNTTSGYTYDGGNRVTRILAPTPAGLPVTCTDANADTTPGCRSLKLDYGTPPRTPAGTSRLLDVTLSIPQTTGQTNLKTVAQYSYDTTGRLTEAWDPRISPALKTTYGYVASGTNGAGRLGTVTPPGENTWSLVYDEQNRISKVQRDVPVGNPISGVTSQTATTTVVYGLTTNGDGTVLPKLTAAEAQTWNQTRSLPVSGSGTAVFPADHIPAGTTASTVADSDWKYATLHYLDVNGRETNTASYGQLDAADGTGHWLIDTTQYDPNGNTVWRLSAGNRAQALSPTSDTDPAVAATASSADRADLLASMSTYNPLDPAEVTDTYGPTHPIQLADGSTIDGRAHAHTDYDQAAPNNDVNAAGVAYRLPTTVTTAPFDVATGADTTHTADIDVVRTGYASVAGMAKSGWDLGLATTSTVQMGASPPSADLVTTTVYDVDGRTIETRLPGDAAGDAAGTSPRTTKTTYYTATGTGTCVSTTSAGLVCQTAPGGQPSGPFASSPLPTTVTSYDSYGNPTSAVETYTSTGAGGPSAPTRTSTTIYDAAERVTQTSMVTANVTGSEPVPAVSYGYDPATGRQTAQSTGSGGSLKTLTTSYDSDGRVRSYTDATGAKTYTGYDIDSRIVSRVDAKGATTWTYDNSSEHRGLVTIQRHAPAPVSTDILGSGGTIDAGGNLDLTSATGEFGFTAGYGAEGSQVVQGYPNGLLARTGYDNAGNTISLVYAKGGSTWMAFSQTNGAGERTVAQSATVNGQAASAQAFGYDNAGRLATVQDTVGPAISGGGSSCVTRQYGFDQHSNRTSLATYPAGTGGTCTTTTTATTVNSSFDGADRITSAGYGIDAMGRTITVPGSDAAGSGTHAGATGQLAVGYYDNDLAASQTQGIGASKQSVTFDVDVEQDRFAGQATVVGDTAPVTTTVTNHYDTGSDSPAWTDTVVTGDAGAGSSWRSYVAGPDGNLAAVVDPTGAATLQLCNLHGDIVATTPATGSATSISDYTETTEYGIPRSAATAKTPYGWVGGKQRSTDDLAGLTLMGVRLYNPAIGRFLSVDSVPAGNANAYSYPTDPINRFDFDGRTQKDGMGDGGGSSTQLQSSKRTREAAEKLAHERNANSLTVAEVDGPRDESGKQTGKRTRYHLRGRSHGNIETPHVHEYTMHSPRPGVWNSSSENVRPMKFSDIAMAEHGTPDMKMP